MQIEDADIPTQVSRELPGIQYLIRIVEEISSFYVKTKNSNEIFMDWFYSNAQNKLGKKRIENYMHENAERSEAVVAFLIQIENFVAGKSQFITQPTLYELVNACYEPSGYRGRGIANRFSRTASMEELNELAKIAVKETNPAIKSQLLWAFRKRPFPLDESYIFELAGSENDSIRDIAFEIMEHLPSDRIHDYAISLLKDKKEVSNALSLLCHMLPVPR